MELRNRIFQHQMHTEEEGNGVTQEHEEEGNGDTVCGVMKPHAPLSARVTFKLKVWENYGSTTDCRAHTRCVWMQENLQGCCLMMCATLSWIPEAIILRI